MTETQMIAELDRIEAETGCELPALDQPATPRKRARRLLDCDEPPVGLDLHLVRVVAGELTKAQFDAALANLRKAVE